MERYNKRSNVPQHILILTVFREKQKIAETLSTQYRLIDNYINF